MEGVLVVDKPAGPTSHDVVQRVRQRVEGLTLAILVDADQQGILLAGLLSAA